MTDDAQPHPLDALPRRLVAVVVGLVLVTRFPGFTTGGPFNSDETTLAVGGRALAEGGQLYVDVIDRKPPLPFLAYRVLGGYEVGAGLVVMRLLIALLVVATALGVAREAGRRHGRRAAWLAGTVAAVSAAALGAADAQAANFELFALLPITLAFVMASRGRAEAAGISLAVAVLCKQPAAVTAIPVAVCLWRAGRWRSIARAGGAGAVAAIVLSVPFGVGRVAEWALLGNGGYLAIDAAELGFIAVRALAGLGIVVAFWGGAWLLALWPAPAEVIGGGPSETTAVVSPTTDGSASPPEDRELWWFLGASLLGVVAGFRFFPHYFLQLVPAIALLAGRGAARRPSLVWPAVALMAVSGALAFAMAWVASTQTEPSWEQPVATAMAEASPCGQPVLVWGNVPELYWRSARLPAGGFTHTEFVTGYSGGRRHDVATEANVPDRELYDEWIARVRLERPPVIVDTAAADLRGGEYFPIRNFPALQQMIDANYQVLEVVDDIVIYLRLDRGPASTPGTTTTTTESCPP